MEFDLTSIDSGATAWVLGGAALVLLMVFGLAFFYGGMVRTKHVLGMLKQNVTCLALVGILWTLIGYSIAFGGASKWWGGLEFIGLHHLDQQVPGYTDSLAQVIPPVVFVCFQLMFAAITPALITGSTADRWRFGGFLAFITVWSLLVYAPVAHWVFSPTGWLFQLGAEDFAGGTVVHANAGAAAIAVALVLGKRLGWPHRESFQPHNVPFVVLGMGLLWFGWFGFNAGSALSAGLSAGNAFLNTMIATSAAYFGWIIIEKLRDGKITPLGGASGAVAGLVAITPACGYVDPLGAMAIGVIAGLLCALATSIKSKVGIDDSLDVGAVHLVGGVVGALLIGLFGTSAIGGADGLFYGGGLDLLGKQAIAVGVVVGYSFVVSLVLAAVINGIRSMRLTPAEEEQGMDITLFGQQAYGTDGATVSTNGSSKIAAPVA